MIRRVGFLFWMVLLLACDGDGVDAGANQFKCNLDGKSFNAKGLYAYAVDFSDTVNAYGIEDAESSSPKTLYIAFKKGLGPGMYSNENDVFALYDADGETYRTDFAGGSISAELVEVDAVGMKGTFSFTATDGGSGKIVATEGSFNVRFR